MITIKKKPTQMFLEAVLKSRNPNLVPKHGINTLGRPYTRFVNPYDSEESYSAKEFFAYTGEFSFKYKPLIVRRCIKLLNQQLEDKDFFNISCAYFKHDLKISTDGRNIALQLEDKKTKNIIARREIKKDINGQTYINNMFLNIENDSYLGIKNTGLGTHLVRKQIETLLKIPEIKYIEINAAGYGKKHIKGKNSVFNGYYIWPCMGFNYRFNSNEYDYLKIALRREGLMHKVYPSKIFKTNGRLNPMSRKLTDKEWDEIMNRPHTKTKQELKEEEAFREILRKKGQDTQIIEEIVITPADGIFWEKIGKDIDPDRRDPWAKKKKKR